jgi:F0F1-type ATP synthase membrane subunit b/b'
MNLDALKQRKQLIEMSLAQAEQQSKSLLGHLAEVNYWIAQLEAMSQNKEEDNATV